MERNERNRHPVDHGERDVVYPVIEAERASEEPNAIAQRAGQATPTMAIVQAAAFSIIGRAP